MNFAPVTPANIAAWLPADLRAPAEARDALADYLNLLLKWNAKTNLVGSNDPAVITRDLVADSLRLAVFMDNILPDFSYSVWEPGAGAGLPGIPLRIIWQKGDYALIEPREKRAFFIANALGRLRLPGVSLFRGRVEDYAKTAPAPDAIVSRAFRPWPELLKLFRPILKGVLIIMATTPPPRDAWPVLASQKYAAPRGERWFWALAAPGV